MHPEDIKAELRKRHGTLASFTKARKLPPCGVSNMLSGKVSRPVANAIADELNLPVTFVFPHVSPTRTRRTSKKNETKPIRESRKREVAVAS
jgi:lambda repressor-like predicted transcriptional regulator